MKSYRWAVDASVCFSIQAETEEEALAKAKALVGECCEGLDVETEDSLDMRVYFSEGTPPDLQDVDEAETQSAEDAERQTDLERRIADWIEGAK
jgi:hypothetical protein